MSADNRIVLTIHPLGGFTLVSQQDSDEGPVRVWDHSPRFDTVTRAVEEYRDNRDNYPSEYGVSFDSRVKHLKAESVFWYDQGEQGLYGPNGYFIVSGDFSTEEGSETHTFYSGVTINRDGKELPPIQSDYPESYFSSDLTFICHTYPKPVGE